jgi:hypothetical protein
LRGCGTTDSTFTFWNSALQAMPFVAPKAMKLFLQSAIVFFGTLLAAALVALGDPGHAEVQMVTQAQPAAATVVGMLGLDE